MSYILECDVKDFFENIWKCSANNYLIIKF
jgi:hypothetical protein